MEFCKKCGFILNARPRVLDSDGVCQACRNNEIKASIDWNSRKEWLNTYIKEMSGDSIYDCVVGVSGGKDSTSEDGNRYEGIV